MPDFNAINQQEQQIRELGGVPERWLRELADEWRDDAGTWDERVLCAGHLERFLETEEVVR